MRQILLFIIFVGMHKNSVPLSKLQKMGNFSRMCAPLYASNCFYYVVFTLSHPSPPKKRCNADSQQPPRTCFLFRIPLRAQ